MSRNRGSPSAEAVVKRHARSKVGALATAAKRQQERDWLYEVWCDAAQKEMAFVQRLSHETEIAAFEIPQTPMDQLRRPTRRAGGEVLALYEPDTQTAGSGIESDADTGDPAADDENVEALASEVVQCVRARH
jgi:hypothetical protein